MFASIPKALHLLLHEDAIPEYVMTTILNSHLTLQRADQVLRRGQWTYSTGRPDFLRTVLSGTRLVLLRYGHIGRAIPIRAKAFGIRVHVATRSTVKDVLVDETLGSSNLPAFLDNADAIVVPLPHLPQTERMVNE